MTLPKDLDSINLIILRAIATTPNSTTREIQSVIYLSRGQVLRRLRALREQNLVIRNNGVAGQTYRYELSPTVTPQEIEEANVERLRDNPDPVAREVLKILLAGLKSISVLLVRASNKKHSDLQ